MVWSGDDGTDVRETRNRADPRHMAVVPDCPAHIAKHAKQHAEHEDEPELRLVHASVAPRHPDDPPVVERARGDQGEGDPNDRSDVRQALPVKNGS